MGYNLSFFFFFLQQAREQLRLILAWFLVESKSLDGGEAVARGRQSERKHPYVHDLESPFDLLPLSRRISLWSPGGRYHLL